MWLKLAGVGFIIVFVAMAVRLIRRTIVAFTSAPCEIDDCPGRMYEGNLPFGIDETVIPCLICDTCGEVLPLTGKANPSDHRT